MSNTTDAHDPSVADYRDTSPRFAQGGKGQMRLPYPMTGEGFALRRLLHQRADLGQALVDLFRALAAEVDH